MQSIVRLKCDIHLQWCDGWAWQRLCLPNKFQDQLYKQTLVLTVSSSWSKAFPSLYPPENLRNELVFWESNQSTVETDVCLPSSVHYRRVPPLSPYLFPIGSVWDWLDNVFRSLKKARRFTLQRKETHNIYVWSGSKQRDFDSTLQSLYTNKGRGGDGETLDI